MASCDVFISDASLSTGRSVPGLKLRIINQIQNFFKKATLLFQVYPTVHQNPNN